MSWFGFLVRQHVERRMLGRHSIGCDPGEPGRGHFLRQEQQAARVARFGTTLRRLGSHCPLHHIAFDVTSSAARCSISGSISPTAAVPKTT